MGYRFNPPPLWPPAPPGWTPPPRWQPPPDWPAPPLGWSLWVAEETAAERTRRERLAAKEGRRRERDEKRSERKVDFERRLTADNARKALCIADEWFGFNRLRVYRDGLVKVGSLEFEPLVALEVRDSTSRKSHLGRAAAAVLTAGWSLDLSSIKGDLIVVVTTLSDVHVLSIEEPRPDKVRSVLRLAAIAQTVIGHDDSPTDAPPAQG